MSLPADETVLYLEYQFDIVCHRYPIAISQSQDLVVVQHGVEVFDPNCVHRSVADYPLPRQASFEVIFVIISCTSQQFRFQ